MIRKSPAHLFKKGKPGGPGRPKGSVNLVVRIKRCADFMESEGWKLLQEIAREKGKNSVRALDTLAAYGYGKPSESLDITTAGKALPVAVDFSRFSPEKLEDIIDKLGSSD